ncbi:MAG: hypothetical protein K9K86_00130 [Pseudomonadales bacterium]|nr:hypothetical protein [Pseudomonadales bacterium]
MNHWSKKAFVYECAMRGFQGSMANPSQHSSIAALVRDAERLWDELQEWEALQLEKDIPPEK